MLLYALSCYGPGTRAAKTINFPQATLNWKIWIVDENLTDPNECEKSNLINRSIVS